MTTTKKYSLPREFAEKWVAALRSGKYRQGSQKLGNSEKGYCCLGVAAKVCGSTDDMLSNGNDVACYLKIGGDYGAKLTRKIFDQIPKELRGEEDKLKENLVAKLINLNDNKHYSFPEIADWIEENVEFV